MTKRYNQLAYEQRCQIYVLNKSGMSQREIASAIEVSQSTISRELARNRGDRGYRFQQAHTKAVERRKKAVNRPKMTPEMISTVESKIRLEWSPEQIAGWLLEDQGQLISHESIYLHIWADKRDGGSLYTHSRRQGKKYDKRRHGKSTRGQIRNRVSIDQRPPIVEERSRVGDWEIDTVIGKGHSGALVTIVERATKFTVSAQVNSKSAADVTRATIALLRPYEGAVYTITADNGKEFAYHDQISKALDADVYFANPYSSWERGLNENTNGLLRQYFPKDTNLRLVTQKQVKHATDRLNTRPRKTLGFKTPGKLMLDHMTKLAA